tara:strand:- start:3440 stop:3940 length:501 start_codon:yes stop_codon:yes gene_type:complete
MIYYINLFYSIYLHVFLLFCFLSIFFWLIISKSEKKSINDEISKGIESGFKDIKISNRLLTSEVEKYLEAYYQGQDITVKKNNNILLIFNIAFISIFLIGFLLAVFVRYKLCNDNFNILEVFGENILILIFVGGIEYYFFMNIASKYIPIKPSYLPSIVEKKIKSL